MSVSSISHDNSGDTTSLTSDHFVKLWLFLLLLAAAYLRVLGNDALSFHYSPDEMMHLQIAKGDSLREVFRFSLFETHPPLGHILRHYWLMISERPGFVRSMSLIFGLLLILVSYAKGKQVAGRLGGMWLAYIVAFSPGCIVESFVLRNYMQFLLLLAGATYFYFEWRSLRQGKLLFGYGLLASLACLTHFSGIFAVIIISCIGGIDVVTDRGGRRTPVQWLVTNLVIWWIWLAVYVEWRSTLHYLEQMNADYFPSMSAAAAVAGALLHALGTFSYEMPTTTVAYACTFLIPALFVYAWRSHEHVLVLACSALAVSMALCGANLYPYVGRRDLWTLPLIVPAAAWVLAKISEFALASLPASRRPVVLHAASCLLIIAGIVSYEPGLWGRDANEFTLREPEWRRLQDFAGSLTSKEVIIATPGQAQLLQRPDDNTYRTLTRNDISAAERWSGDFASLTTEIGHTRVLFPRGYLAHDDASTFVSMMLDAQKAPWMQETTTLVFLEPAFIKAEAVLRCGASTVETREIVQRAETVDGIPALHWYAVSIPKKTFYNDIVSPTGRFHHCLATY